MSLINRIMATIARFAPDRPVDPLLDGPGYVGQAVARADGPLKVKGEAKFSAEYDLENLAYAALVVSVVSRGKILKMATEVVEELPGVIAVITHQNAPKLNKPPVSDPGGGSSGASASDLPIFQDNEIHWNGQPVAVIVAESQEQAEYAASRLEVTYERGQADLDFDALLPTAKFPKDVQGEPPEEKIGDAEAALALAPVTVDAVYRTPRYNHCAIEPHACVARWSKDEDGQESLTVFDGTQSLYAFKNTLAEVFSVEKNQVRFISPFVGGAFGSKGAVWTNTILCALAARVTGRPVKLALSRQGVFRTVGGRTLSKQRVALGAAKDGRFTALIHSGTVANTPHNQFPEQFTFPARRLYSAESMHIFQKVLLLDTVANTFMRAPGESIGTFALESAIDELSYKLEIDPIELRRRNEPQKDVLKGTEFSHRALTLAYQKGAKAFGWERREPKSQRHGDWLIGQGVATAYYPYYRMAATARVRISADGTAVVSAAAHEMGMGTATAQIQHAAQRLGLPLDSVSFAYGDSDLPESPIAGGSNQTASIVASVTAAVEKVHHDLLALLRPDSPIFECAYEQLEARGGGLYIKGDSAKGQSYADILQAAGETHIEVEAPAASPMEILKYSMHSYGAQFAEVRVHEVTGEVRVSRFLGSFDTGRILNPRTAFSQFRGGIIMGLGMALTEETLFDQRYGRILNPSLAEYHVPVNLDVPHIEILTTDIPDPHSPLGVHGVGEIGITGVAAAVANAVYNATGVRVRSLPITLDKLLPGL